MKTCLLTLHSVIKLTFFILFPFHAFANETDRCMFNEINKLYNGHIITVYSPKDPKTYFLPREIILNDPESQILIGINIRGHMYFEVKDLRLSADPVLQMNAVVRASENAGYGIVFKLSRINPQIIAELHRSLVKRSKKFATYGISCAEVACRILEQNGIQSNLSLKEKFDTTLILDKIILSGFKNIQNEPIKLDIFEIGKTTEEIKKIVSATQQEHLEALKDSIKWNIKVITIGTGALATLYYFVTYDLD